eukprot:m.233818 g.233818  ORF g.233818 m.233818 type:complete len:620 (+) comp33649_c3_seq1:199-2058(+)
MSGDSQNDNVDVERVFSRGALPPTTNPGIEVNVTLDRPKALCGLKNTMNALVRVITAAPTTTTMDRPPLHIACVIDRSGSMEGSKLTYAKRAITKLIKHLTPKDVLHLICYDSSVDIVFTDGDLSAGGKRGLEQQVKAIRARSTTNLNGAIQVGAETLQKTMQRLRHKCATEKTPIVEPAARRIMLFSDGLVNCGETNQAKILDNVKALVAQGITVSTFGIGNDFDEPLMTGIAEVGGGHYGYLGTAEDIPKIVGKSLHDLLEVAATKATLELRGVNGAIVTKVHNNDDDIAKNATNHPGFVPLGDLHQDNVRSVLVEFEFSATQPEGFSGPVLEYEFVCVLPPTTTTATTNNDDNAVVEVVGEAFTITGQCNVTLIKSRQLLPASNPEIVAAFAVQNAAELDKQVVNLVRSGEQEQAKKVKQTNIAALENALVGLEASVEHKHSDFTPMIKATLTVAREAMARLEVVQAHDEEDYCRYETSNCINNRRMSVCAFDDRCDSDEERDWSDGWSDNEDSATLNVTNTTTMRRAQNGAQSRTRSRSVQSSDVDMSDSDSEDESESKPLPPQALQLQLQPNQTPTRARSFLSNAWHTLTTNNNTNTNTNRIKSICITNARHIK